MERVLRAAALIGTWFPAAAIVSLYGDWLAACVALGRRPVPLHDDPKYIGALNAGVHWVAVLVLSGGAYPYLASLSILAVASLVPNLPNRRAVRRRLSIAAAGGLLAYTLIRWDPGRIVEWFMD